MFSTFLGSESLCWLTEFPYITPYVYLFLSGSQYWWLFDHLLLGLQVCVSAPLFGWSGVSFNLGSSTRGLKVLHIILDVPGIVPHTLHHCWDFMF